MEPVRNFLRHKKAAVKFYEAEATKIDYTKKIVYINDESEVKGATSLSEVPFDMLVVGVGAENATFGTLGNTKEIREVVLTCLGRYPWCPRALLLPEGGCRRSTYPQAYYGLL